MQPSAPDRGKRGAAQSNAGTKRRASAALVECRRFVRFVPLEFFVTALVTAFMNWCRCRVSGVAPVRVLCWQLTWRFRVLQRFFRVCVLFLLLCVVAVMLAPSSIPGGHASAQHAQEVRLRDGVIHHEDAWAACIPGAVRTLCCAALRGAHRTRADAAAMQCVAHLQAMLPETISKPVLLYSYAQNQNKNACLTRASCLGLPIDCSARVGCPGCPRVAN